MLEIPNLSDENIIARVAGIRPYRQTGIRLEREETQYHSLFHNYGHGGAGFTLAWGCAEIVADWAAASCRSGSEVAVIGGGVIGLTTARALQEKQLRPVLYAKAFPPHTTSDLAGAQWSPSAVARGRTPAELARFDDLLIRSFRRYEKLEGDRYGVTRKMNFVAEGFGGPLDRVPGGVIPLPEPFEYLPFPGAHHPGKLYYTFLIEPPIFLPALMNDLRHGGAAFIERGFASREDLLGIPQKIVINCSGFGAARLFSDTDLIPVRGHLVYLKPQPLPYLLVHEGYVFPRKDAVVLGGTFEKGVMNPAPSFEIAQHVLELNRRFFT